jgi:hypothetical protein
MLAAEYFRRGRSLFRVWSSTSQRRRALVFAGAQWGLKHGFHVGEAKLVAILGGYARVEPRACEDPSCVSCGEGYSAKALSMRME